MKLPDQEGDLVAQRAWLRRLVRRWVADPDLADDLEQDVWLAALRGPPPHGGSLRAWLVGITRNSLRLRLRGERRRVEREKVAAVPDHSEPTADVVARQAFLARVGEVLLELEEPYRGALWARYVEGLTPREIARRERRPVRTVHSHLARGLRMMRGRLRAEPRARRSRWAPIAWWRAGGRMGRRGMLAAAGSVVVALWVVPFAPRESGDPSATPASTVALPTAPSSAVRAPGRPRSPLLSTAAAAPSVEVRGVVVDARGVPVSGATVTYREGVVRTVPGSESRFAADEARPQVRAPADAHGEFVMRVPRGSAGQLTASAAGWVPVVAALVGRGPARARTLVMAPRRTLSGVVRDPAGRGIAGAAVRLVHAERSWRAVPRAFHRPYPVHPWVVTDAAGHFTLQAAYRVDSAHLVVAADGYTGRRVPLPQDASAVIGIELTGLPSADVVLRGRVVDAAGAAIADAVVGFGPRMVGVDADGGFELSVDRLDHIDALCVAAPGRRPRSIPRTGLSGSPGAPLTLRLENAALRIAGRVIDHGGNPVAGAEVWIADPTPIGDDHRPWFAEPLVLGRRTDPCVRVKCDDRGQFALGGLADRDYVVRCMVKRSLVCTEAVLRAGTEDAMLVVDTDRVHARLRGIARTPDGAPVEGATVIATVPVLSMQIPTEDPSSPKPLSINLNGRRARTDAGGRFAFAGLATEGVTLHATSPETLVAYAPLTAETQSTVEITMVRRVLAQVELEDPATADAFGVCNEAGTALWLYPRIHGERNPFRLPRAKTRPIEGGRSDVLVLPETARSLILFRVGVEVARHEIALQIEGLNVLRPGVLPVAGRSSGR